MQSNFITAKTLLIIILAAAVCALTLVVRIPTPAASGYLDLGDMGVIFCGLFLGRKWGAIAGGVGSAAADLIGGFFIFVPITLIAKGLEGYFAGALSKKNPYWLSLAALVMVVSYFIAEVFLPGMGWTAAISELPFNVAQGIMGAIGGYYIYCGVSVQKTEDEENV